MKTILYFFLMGSLSFSSENSLEMEIENDPGTMESEKDSTDVFSLIEKDPRQMEAAYKPVSEVESKKLPPLSSTMARLIVEDGYLDISRDEAFYIPLVQSQIDINQTEQQRTFDFTKRAQEDKTGSLKKKNIKKLLLWMLNRDFLNVKQLSEKEFEEFVFVADTLNMQEILDRLLYFEIDLSKEEDIHFLKRLDAISGLMIRSPFLQSKLCFFFYSITKERVPIIETALQNFDRVKKIFFHASELDLQMNSIYKILLTLKSIQELGVLGGLDLEDGLKYLPKLPKKLIEGIESISISGIFKNSQHLWNFLEKCKNLVSVSIKSDLNDDGGRRFANVIEKQRGLQYLTLVGSFGNDGATALISVLQGFQNLQSISLQTRTISPGSKDDENIQAALGAKLQKVLSILFNGTKIGPSKK